MKAPDFEPTPLAIGRWKDWRWQAHVLLWAFPAAMLVLASPGGAKALAVMSANMLCWLSAVALQVLVCPVRPAELGSEDDSRCMTIWPLGLYLDGLFSSFWRLLNLGISRIARMPLANAVVAFICAISLGFLNVQMSWNPLVFAGPWTLDSTPLEPWGLAWWLGRLGHAHWVLALAALLPATPMAGGQMLAVLLDELNWSESDARQVRRWSAAGTAIGLAGLGLAAVIYGQQGGYVLLIIGLIVGFEARRQERRDDTVAFLENFINSAMEDESELDTFLENLNQRPPRKPPVERLKDWWQARRMIRAQKRFVLKTRQEKADEERLDQLLALIHEKGSEQLSRNDRKFLERMAREYKERRNGE